MDVFGHSVPTRTARSEIFMESYVQNNSVNLLVLGPKDNLKVVCNE